MKIFLGTLVLALVTALGMNATAVSTDQHQKMSAKQRAGKIAQALQGAGVP